MTLQVLDPTHEDAPIAGTTAPRPARLTGLTVGFISNGKEGTKGFFRHLEGFMKQELGVANVVWRVKSNYSAPADPPIMAEIKDWNAVITGVGD